MKVSPLLLAALVALVAGCASSDKTRTKPDSPFIKDVIPLEEKRNAKKDKQMPPDERYRRARAALEDADFHTAIEEYDKLITIHPFSDYATQGELERIYSEYRSYEPDRALTHADKFLREHPRHPAVDYVQYVKGLVNFRRDDDAMSFMQLDHTMSDVTNQRRAFDDFALLLQKYPNSKYAGDSYQRMVYIRGRLADHELHVVDFYIRRGAYVAAAKRAEQIIALYPGTKGSYVALESLAICYDKAGLESQASDARRLIAAQPQLRDLPAAPGEPGFFSRLLFGRKSEIEMARSSLDAPPPKPADATSAKAESDVKFYSDAQDKAPATAAPAGDDGTDKKPAPIAGPPPDTSTPATTAAPVITAPIGK